METKEVILPKTKVALAPGTISFPEHGDEIEEIVSKKTPFIVMWGTVFFLIFLLLLVAICWLIQYPDIVIASARLNSINAPKQVFTRTGGKLVKITITEGQKVTSGQILGYMESIANPNSIIQLDAQIDSVISLIEHNRTDEITKYFPQSSSLATRGSDVTLGELQHSYQMLIQAFGMFKDFLRNGVYQRKKNALMTETEYIENLNAILLSQKERIQQDFSLGIIVQRNTFIRALQTMKSQIQAWQYKYCLKAPVSGSVSFTGFFQENQEMKTGQPVFYIQPDSTSYFMEMVIPQYNFGKVKQGQKVLLKFQAYPFEQYGSVVGRIDSINSTPTDSGYLAKVMLPNRLTTNCGQELSYRSGLFAQAYIITENVRILEKFYYTFVKKVKVE